MLRKSMLSGFLFLYAGTMGFVWSEENSSLDLDFNETARETPHDFNDTPKETKDTKRSLAYVIPIKDQIGAPVLDILRRGIKDAIKAKATTVVLDMDTPGGELGVTLEMMQEIVEAFERFDGPVVTYVNSDAISAGAYIAIATNEIAFAPYGQIGAAEAVSGGGGNIDSGMKRKINSYLKAKIRNFSGQSRYRSRVMAAMMDANETLVVEGIRPTAADGSLIQKDGELLTLTAEEAVKAYGDPPEPLLGIGIYKTVEELLEGKHGKGNFDVVKMEINWAEELGLWLSGIAPILLGLGMLCLFIEFKTPGFGVFGGVGLALLLVFFGSKYVTGFAGHEEVIVFLLGVGLVALEIFLFPGLMVPALLGILLMLGSLLWAMVDIWPVPDFEWSPALFREPIQDLGLGLLISLGLGIVAMKFLPKTPLWNQLTLQAEVGEADPIVTGGASSTDAPQALPEKGSTGMAITQLYPSGKVEIEGRRYEAQSRSGTIRKGEEIKVVGHRDFNLLVEKGDLS